MKTLHYRRHSKKSPDNTLSLEGIALAIQEGEEAEARFSGSHGEVEYSCSFHGPLVRTAQTLLAFSRGLGYVPEPQPVVAEMGDDALFAQIATPEMRQAVADGASNFQALLATHGKDKAKDWALDAAEGVCKMFNAMADGETAVAFGHSPVIELAAWGLLGISGLPEGNRDRLSDMEGIVFIQDEVKLIMVGDKICVV